MIITSSSTNNTAAQNAAIEKLSRLKVGALFMEMGTGKTKTALDLIHSKYHKVDYVLWICPVSLKAEIENERQKWYPEMTFDVVGVESIGSSPRIFTETLEKVTRAEKAFVVVDESLKIKNIRAKCTQRIILIGDQAEYKLILNGTPVSKNALDMWTQMEFLSPKILNMSYGTFRRKFCRIPDKGKMKGKVVGQCNTEHLASLIEPYIFEAKLDIKAKKTYSAVRWCMDNEEMAGYEALKEEIIDNAILDEDGNLRDIDFYTLITALQSYYSKTSSCKEAIQEAVDRADGKCIVFVKYLDCIPPDRLAITGDVSAEDRKAIIDRFRDGDDKELYITYGCGAYGLNFQFCHNIVFANHTWDYAQRIQAEARIYRTGQTEDANYTDVLGYVGLETMITQNQSKKDGLLNEIKAKIQEMGVKECLKTF